MASLHINIVGEVETSLGLHDVPEHGNHISILFVDLQLDVCLLALEIL